MAATPPPAHHRTIAKHVAAVAGRAPRITVMNANGTTHVQAIAELDDFPVRGSLTLATVGLSDHGGFELATLTSAKNKSVVKAVFDVASYVAAGDRQLKPGEVFEKVLARYYAKSNVSHWLTRAQAPRGLDLAPLSLPERTISWLFAWPMTSDELVWLNGSPPGDLGALLDAAGLAAFDLSRKSLKGVPVFDPW